MGRIVLAWELGAGLGHAMPLSRLAQALLDRGHDVHLVWKDLASCSSLFADGLESGRLHLWQAPLWLYSLQGLPEAANYAELLLQAGYLDEGAMIAIARAWRGLMTAIEPDLLVCDHAPTALLAARGLPFSKALFGNGFGIPPACSPMVALREWEPGPASRLASADERALLTCNQVLAALRQPPFAALHELLAVDEKFLLGWPELDHYRPYRSAQPLHSWGWPDPRPLGEAPGWPSASGPRILAYLPRDHPAFDAVVACLSTGPWATSLLVPGAADDEVRRCSNSRLHITNRPIHITRGLEMADLLLSHSGSGSLYHALSAGLPAVLLPTHFEQMLLARRVASAGAGVFLWPHEVQHSLTRAIDAVTGSPGFAASARALAARNDASVHGDVPARMASRCEQLIAPAR